MVLCTFLKPICALFSSMNFVDDDLTVNVKSLGMPKKMWEDMPRGM